MQARGTAAGRADLHQRAVGRGPGKPVHLQLHGPAGAGSLALGHRHPANASLFIRGIGPSGNTPSFEQSVSLFVDQIYGGRNRQFMQPFSDVERIELLRGPQGALFGRNTSAGAVSVMTRRPTCSFEGSLSGDVELVRGSHALEMTASGPATETLSLRIAARYHKGIAWLDNAVLDRREPVREDITARVSALWEPAADVTVFGRLDYGHADIVGTSFEFVPGGGRPVCRNAHDNGLRGPGDRSAALNGVLQADIGLGDHVLTAVTGYSGFDYVTNFNIQVRTPARLVTENREHFWQWSQELRLASPADWPLRHIVGGCAESSKSDIFRLAIIDPPRTEPHLLTDHNYVPGRFAPDREVPVRAAGRPGIGKVIEPPDRRPDRCGGTGDGAETLHVEPFL